MAAESGSLPLKVEEFTCMLFKVYVQLFQTNALLFGMLQLICIHKTILATIFIASSG
jgi:hypothetical protein